MHVLICEDDKPTRLVVRRMIETELGWRVSEAGDGVEALDMLGRESFSLLLLDVEMPVLNGIETLEEIRASAVTRDLPVVILSGHPDNGRVGPLVALGIADYIVKPVHKDTALAKLRRVSGTLSPVAAPDRTIKLGPQTPALLVDGNQEFRRLFREQVAGTPIAETATAVSALVAFRNNPVPLVFVGDDLGVISAERLAARLRDARPTDLRLVRIVARTEDGATDLFDDRLVRSDVAGILRTRLRPFVIPTAA